MVAKRFGLGIDVGGTFTDIVVYDAATGRQASRKELTTHDDPARGVMAGIDRLLRRERDRAGRHRPAGARHHALLQRADRAQGRSRPGSSPPRASATRSRSGASASTSSTTSTSSSRLRWCRATCAWRCRSGWPSTAACACPSTRRAVLAAAAAAGGGGRHLARHRLPAFLRQPGPRAAGRGAAGEALPRPHAVGLHRGGARDPRVRARLDHGHQRLHQAAGRALHLLAREPDRGARDRRAAAADAVERRPHQHRGGQAHAGAAAGIGPGCRRAGRRAPGRRRRGQARAGLRHGRHHRQALDRRRRQAHGRLQLRGRAREALRRGQRPAGAHLDPGADRDRRRRRLDRPSRRHRAAEGRAAPAPAPSPAPPPTGGAARSRPSPMPTSCWAISIRPISSAARWRIDMAAAEAAMRPLAERAGLERRRPRLGHPRRRQREHGERGARAHRRARQGPPPLRAAVHRRRRPGARLLRRQEAGPAAG